MDKIQKYPKTTSAAVIVDSNGKTLETALTAMNSSIGGKIDAPSSEGTSGQALVTDGNGGRSWQTISGDCNLIKTDEGGYRTAETAASASTGSFAIGIGTAARGVASIAQGFTTTASGMASHAEGKNSTASGDYSHAEGEGTTASGNHTHAEGISTTAGGSAAHTEGYTTIANGGFSHAEGCNTRTNNNYEHAEGCSNLSTAKTESAPGTLHSVGIGTNDEDRKNAFEIDTDGNVFVLGVGNYNGKNLNTEGVTGLKDNISPRMVEITHAELKTKRDASTLVAGTWYRITDYECTTAMEGTTSAGNLFDVIVRADSASMLNENAYAIQSARDTDGYFAECNLSAWELKYCLDNDTDRFAWADSTNGKGVIYYMKDEFNNECPYDFKNIQFYRSYNSSTGLFSTINTSATGVACYTFSNEIDSSATSTTDMSLAASKNIRYNVIKGYVFLKKLKLNNNCFFGYNNRHNALEVGSVNNTFGYNCAANTFGYNCTSNTFASSFQDNTLGNGCHGNIFGKDCYSNILEDNCTRNTFGIDCTYNTFGMSCKNNTIKSSYSYDNKFIAGTSYVILTSDWTTSDYYPLKNIIIYPSKSGTSSANTTITVPVADRGTTTTIQYGSIETRE